MSIDFIRINKLIQEVKGMFLSDMRKRMQNEVLNDEEKFYFNEAYIAHQKKLWAIESKMREEENKK